MIQINQLKYEKFNRDSKGELIGKNIIFDGLTLDIEQGEIISIFGENGSGKTIFARHLNRMIVPENGKIKICGLDTDDIKN